jgi:hypothetical protein
MSNGTESLVPAPPDPSEFDGQSVVPVVVVTMVISIIFVSMRVWSRAVILHVVGLEDWFILIALVRVFAFRPGSANIEMIRSLLSPPLYPWLFVSLRPNGAWLMIRLD